MPLADRGFRDGELFAVMDMNLPEGFLLAQLRERSPKSPPSKMQLLALAGSNGVGRLGYREPDRQSVKKVRAVSRRRLLREGSGRRGKIFLELVDAHRGALDAEVQALELELTARRARLDLELATGGTTR